MSVCTCRMQNADDRKEYYRIALSVGQITKEPPHLPVCFTLKHITTIIYIYFMSTGTSHIVHHTLYTCTSTSHIRRLEYIET